MCRSIQQWPRLKSKGKAKQESEKEEVFLFIVRLTRYFYQNHDNRYRISSKMNMKEIK